MSKVKLTLQEMLDGAFRQCRVLPQNISGEMLENGKVVLQNMFDALPTHVTPLWAQDRQLIAVPSLAREVHLPDDSIDVLSIYWREWRQRHVGPIIDYGTNQTQELDGREEINVVGVMFNRAVTQGFRIETSLDGSNYTLFKDVPAQAFPVDTMMWFEAEPALFVNYVRLVGVARIALKEFYLGMDANDLPVDRVNRESFQTLPPDRKASRPISYWVDRQADEPVVNLWPRFDGTNPFGALHVTRQRHVQELGDLTDFVEIPRRWKEGIIAMLAYRIALNTPQIDITIINSLKPLADEMKEQLSTDERDPAPINISYGISGYTR